MNVEDYYPEGKRWWLRLHEKGGKQHEMPAHHLLEKYLDDYTTAVGIAADKSSPLFRTLGGRGRKQLNEARNARQDARRMIVRRALAAGIIASIGCHTFRATGITVYLLNGGCSNTPSRWRRTRARAQPSSTTAAMIRSLSIKSRGSYCSHLSEATRNACAAV